MAKNTTIKRYVVHVDKNSYRSFVKAVVVDAPSAAEAARIAQEQEQAAVIRILVMPTPKMEHNV